jgi:anti-sigma factor RsiW
MMGHPAEQTLLAYLDRELPVDERSTVREHVQVCAACSGMLDELVAVTRSLADAISALDVPAPALLAS